MLRHALHFTVGLALTLTAATNATAQNQALNCNTAAASGYIDLPVSPLLTPGRFTIEAWVTYDDATLPTGWVYPTIARKNFTQGLADWFLRVDAGNSGARTLRFWANGSGGVVNVYWPFAAGALQPWTHVAATYDGTTAILYVNGAQVAQSSGTGALVDLGSSARIGAGDVAPGAAQERWNGLIDEVRIWDTARTQPQIMASMGQPLLMATGLVASYQLNGDGLDSSGNNLHGVGMANPTFAPGMQGNGPTTYCTAGTTSNNCVASIAASANPNVAHSTPCQITITSVEGQKSGIIFYGLSALPQPWCPGGAGSSFLCVKPPTQRSLPQSSGGTLNQCDGTLALDWNAFQVANPTGLGTPWTAGAIADVQGWFRDPSACRTTSLSDAVELTYLP